MSLILALDQGTTSSRAVLVDKSGKIEGIAQQEFEQLFPQPGWVEHDPDKIWSSQLDVVNDVLEKSRINPKDLAALGITNQRETALVWERSSGEPICNAIVWQDRRTASMCDRLKKEGHEPLFKNRTGLLLDSYFSGTKVSWMLDNVEGARGKADAGELAFGTVDSWLIWKLTGGSLHITDATNASRTLLYNIHDGRWDDELLGILGIPRSMLPEVRNSSEVYAETSEDVFGTPIPIAGIAGDQQAALFGQMCVEEGMVKNTYGTGCFMLMHTGSEAVPSENNLVTTIASQIDGRVEYALEGSVFVAGAVVQWLRDGLKIINHSAEVEALARTVEDNGGVYLVPAFTGLGAPHWDQYARGIIAGLTRGATSGHLARAALEGIAYQVADVLEAMEADSGLRTAELRVDGGAAVNDLLIQFQSDILDVEVARPQILETTALGAAYLAGLAVGYWKDLDEIAEQWHLDRSFSPSMEGEEIDRLRNGWNRAVERAQHWEPSEQS